MKLRNLVACVAVVCASGLASPLAHSAPPASTTGREINLSPQAMAAIAFSVTKRNAESKVGEMVPACEIAYEACWGAAGAASTLEAKRTIVRNAKRALTAERDRIRSEFLGIIADGKSNLQRTSAGRSYLDDLETVKRAGLRQINSAFERTLRQLDGLAR